VIFGHSMGSLLGFEVARALRSRGRPGPAHLLMSGLRAPQLLGRGAMLHTLPDAAFVQEVHSRYGGIPEPLLQDREYMKLFIPLLRADIGLIETYRYSPQAPLDTPLSAWGGAADRLITRDDLTLWRDQTTSAFSCTLFPGGHFFVNTAREQVLREVARIIDEIAIAEHG
jgi:surfactin synthase thioesterase subunit